MCARGRLRGLRDLYGELLAAASEHLGDDVFLPREVVEDRGPGDVRALADVAHRRGVVAALREESDGALDDALLGLELLACSVA
jgi:hypothetical protein